MFSETALSATRAHETLHLHHSHKFSRHLLTLLPNSLTVAEYFRDEEGQDVLLFIDNIFVKFPINPHRCSSC